MGAGGSVLNPSASGDPGSPDGRAPPFGPATVTPESPSLDEAWSPYLVQSTKGDTWKTYKIVSGPEIKKIKGPVTGEIWGKYKKIYSKPFLGSTSVFNPPIHFYIDDAKVLCHCRDIQSRLYPDNKSLDKPLLAKIMTGAIKPACYQDYTSIYRPNGDLTFDLYVNHPTFYEYMVSNNGSVGIIEGIAKTFIGGKRYSKTRSKKLKKKIKKTIKKARYNRLRY